MELLRKCLARWNIDIDDTKLDMFEEYYKLLISWNDKINLTSVTKKDDVIIKHFTDSLALLNYLDISGKNIIDIGTGAGFPGIPLKIMCPSCNIVLLDSLNKRVSFLDKVINTLGLSGIHAVHGRAEELAFDIDYRERFDLAVSRAVADLRVLAEYCLPFVDLSGLFISYKGGNIEEELSGSIHSISILGGSFDRIEKFLLPATDIERSFVFISKIQNTSDRFPRKAGRPLKKPL